MATPLSSRPNTPGAENVQLPDPMQFSRSIEISSPISLSRPTWYRFRCHSNGMCTKNGVVVGWVGGRHVVASFTAATISP